MRCIVHQYDGPGPCNDCLEEITEKSEQGTLTDSDLPLVKELQKWVDKEISKKLDSSFKD